MGLPHKTSFSEVTSESFSALKLEEVCGTVEKVGVYIGSLAEDHVNESNLGELFYASLKDQYTLIRDGCRFYFENIHSDLFTYEERSLIRSTGMDSLSLFD